MNESTEFILERIAYLEGQDRYFAAHPEKRSSSRERARAKTLALCRAELTRRAEAQ